MCDAPIMHDACPSCSPEADHVVVPSTSTSPSAAHDATEKNSTFLHDGAYTIHIEIMDYGHEKKINF
jgi:hypothetical protein